ncbi:MAG: Ig-like domain-containing protein [Patulibacter sp.]
MTFLHFRRVLPAALLLVGAATFGSATASASTWTVDDDRVQCPSAGFSSIQAAVEQAAPWDTIVVCDGLYLEQSTPNTHANSPAQAGSRNGITITKPLTIKGAGADKVTIRPHPNLGSTLAGTAPYLRDGGGNVITISRQSLGSSDDNENFVSISGVTVESPDAYAEAGIAFFNTSGRIADSVVGPLRRSAPDTELTTRPHGWGVVMTNSLQGTVIGGIRREVSVVDSLVTGYQAGGILFDDARGADGATTLLARSGINAYGHVVGTRVEGGGAMSAVSQTGVQFHAGQRGSVVDSEVVGNSSGTARNAVGVLLTDAEIGDDIANPGTPALRISGNQFSGNGYAVFNATIDNGAVRPDAPVPAADNFWGCATGPVTTASNATTLCQGRSGNAGSPAAASVVVDPFRADPAPGLVVPAVTPDDAPTAAFLDPIDGLEVPVGAELLPTVQATDDFGVRAVSVTADGARVGARSTRPYEFAWTPGPEQAGRTVRLEATVVDSAGQETTTAVSVLVTGTAVPGPVPPPAPPAPPTLPLQPPTTVAAPSLSGVAVVGGRVACSTGTWTRDPSSYGFAWLRDGVVVPGAIGSSYVLKTTDVGATIACRVTARNADGVSAPATSGSSTVQHRTVKSPYRTTVRIGRAIAVLDRTAVLARSGRTVKVARVTCSLAGPCTVKTNGTAKVGRTSKRFTVTTRIAAGRTATITVTVPNAVRNGINAKRSGRLRLTTAVTSQGSTSRYVSNVTLKRR